MHRSGFRRIDNEKVGLPLSILTWHGSRTDPEREQGTGGPFAVYFAALWGLKHCKRLRAHDQELATMLTVIATFVGCGFAAKHCCEIKFSTNAIRSGVGMLMGQTFLFGGSIGGRVPSLLYQAVYRLRGIKVDTEERMERLG